MDYQSIDTAVHRTVHEHPGGLECLADTLGIRRKTLANKTNPRQPHQVTLHEAVAIQRATGTSRILSAMAGLLGYSVVELGDWSSVSDVELLDSYAAYHADVGSTAQAIRESLSDGVIRKEEVDRIEQEFFSDVRAGLAFIARLRGLQVDTGEVAADA